jgi:deoxyribodipyrimidine photo-lyase
MRPNNPQYSVLPGKPLPKEPPTLREAKSGAPVLVWFRRDLRLADNPALSAAGERGAPVLAVFVWTPEERRAWLPSDVQLRWLHHSLAALRSSLLTLGCPLLLRRGGRLAELRLVAAATGSAAVYWNRLYEPDSMEEEVQVASGLRADGLEVRTFPSDLLHEPEAVRTRSGGVFRVFTPFLRACRALPEPAPPLAAPHRFAEGSSNVVERVGTGLTLSLEELGLLRGAGARAGHPSAWAPGEAGAEARLTRFVGDAVAAYAHARELPGVEGTSRLSPHLHFGEISPRRVWHAVRKNRGDGAEAFLEELAWREFSRHLLVHYPRTPEVPLRPEFASFPWEDDPQGLEAWRRGSTGYPLVDAGMRELAATGWMHNRVRMVAASFLVKDLLIAWPEGARWFWDSLVDADLANNTLGWQWTAGCGADAAPYFRIFNPVTQSERFDAQAYYIRRWVPELARLPLPFVHRPWSAPSAVLLASGVKLGESYPHPLVDHSRARAQALAAFASIRGSS